MTELLNEDVNAGLINQCRPPAPRFQGGMLVSRPSSRERRVAAATALFISGAKPSLPISTSSAAAVVPPGEVTFSRSTLGVERRAVQQFARAGDGFARELCRQRRRQAGRGAGLRQRFGEQKDVGRSRAGHRRHRVHQRFVVDPLDRAGRREQAVREVALRAVRAAAAPRR